MKKLGVIGGLGPIATAYFYELIIKMTDAHCDQEHLEMIIYNCPSIPDRTSYILHKSEESPVHKMVEVGEKLCEEQVDYIAIPCITAHYFYSELATKINAPIIHMIEKTVFYLRERKYKTIGIMATDGTVQSGLFQQELRARGLQAVLPDAKEQEYVMDLIYRNVKANEPVEIHKFYSVAAHLKRKGAEVIILGCTELSLIKRDYTIGEGFVDAMEVLAMNALLCCDMPLKQEYRNLITNKETLCRQTY